MLDVPTIEVTSTAFARRLANLLVERRRQSGKSLRALARASNGRFRVRDLQSIEEARVPLDERIVGEVALLYQADLGVILPERLPLEIRPFGVMSTSGLTAPFIPDDSTSLLVSYLRLVRQLRHQQREPLIELRSEDVDAIAAYLGEPGTTVVERLGALMGATMTQRRAMAGLFVAGAVVVGLAGGSVAALGTGTPRSGVDATPGTGSAPAAVDAGAATSTLAPATSAASITVSSEVAPTTAAPASTVTPSTVTPSNVTPSTVTPSNVTPDTVAPAPATTAPIDTSPATTLARPAATTTTVHRPAATTTTVIVDPNHVFGTTVPGSAQPIPAPSTTVDTGTPPVTVDPGTPPVPTPAPTTTAQATDLPPVPTPPTTVGATP